MKIRLNLRGMLQSWGMEEPWTAQRHTQYKPTESGIYGLIECSMGLARAGTDENDDCRRNALRTNTRITSISEPENMPEILTDFQTVHPLVEGLAFKKAEGGTKTNGLPTINKEYIVGGRYTVELTGDKDTIENVMFFLRHPVYPICLGRSICIPSESVFLEILEE